MKNLNNNIDRYFTLKAEQFKIEEEMKALKEEIIKEMKELNTTVHTSESGVTAKLGVKTTYKYKDEEAMIKWLEKNGFKNYISKKVNTTPLNKELTKGGILTEGLANFYIKNQSISLTVDNKQ